MVRVLFSENVTEFIVSSKSGLRLQIKKKFERLKENSSLGDYVFGIENIDCREIKVEGLRFFTICYRNQSFVLDIDDFKDILKVVEFAKKNKLKEQQKIIDDIKARVRKFGMNI